MGEPSEGPKDDTCHGITEEQVKLALNADKGSAACLTSWSVVDFTKTGDNYIGLVTSVEVEYTMLGEACKITYIVKIVSEVPSKGFNDVFQYLSLMEIKYYTELIPALNAELTAVNDPGLRCPRHLYNCIEGGRTMIFLEDLRARGFRMHSRHQGLDVAHVSLVLEELARLHGASLLLQARTPHSPLHHHYPYLANTWFNISPDAKDTSEELVEGSIDNAILALEKVGGYSTIVKWLHHLKSSPLEHLEDKCTDDNVPFITLCHGDCWTNNFLFRYSDGGVPEEVMMIDLQLGRVASLAMDLNYFLFLSLDGPVRRENTQAFLNTYYSALSRLSSCGGVSVGFTLTQLHQECRNKHPCAAINTAIVVPLIISESGDVPDFQYMTDEKKNSYVEKMKNYILEKLIKDPIFKPRFLSVYEEMIDFNVMGSVNVAE